MSDINASKNALVLEFSVLMTDIAAKFRTVKTYTDLIRKGDPLTMDALLQSATQWENLAIVIGEFFDNPKIVAQFGDRLNAFIESCRLHEALCRIHADEFDTVNKNGTTYVLVEKTHLQKMYAKLHPVTIPPS